MLPKEANKILETTVTYIKQIQNIADDIEQMLKTQIKIENIVETNDLFSTESSIPQMYFNELRYQQLNIIYPNILWSSLFLTAYANLESSLDLLSDYFFHKTNLNISPEDLKDSGIKRSKKYLVKLVGLNFPYDRIEWKSIIEVAHIRHCIIHTNGIVSQYRNINTINSVIHKYQEIRIEDDHIIITKEFVRLFTTWCEHLLLSIKLNN